MKESLVPYADTIALLRRWRDKGKQEDAPELRALQRLDHEQLIEAMKGILAYAETEERFSAVDALPYLVSSAVLSELLVPYLADPIVQLRWTICELFHGYPDPHVVLPLAQVLREDIEPDVRLVAAEALHAVGDERAIPFLIDAANHDTGKDYEDRAITDAARNAIAAIQQRIKERAADEAAN
jgi:HEAT repeat protein